MSYLTRITLHMYEQQTLQSVLDWGIGIVRGGSSTNVLFRFRSFIHLNKFNLSSGINMNGDVVVWKSQMFKSANEATATLGEKVKIIEIADFRVKRGLTREDTIVPTLTGFNNIGGLLSTPKMPTKEEYEAFLKQEEDKKSLYEELTGKKVVERPREMIPTEQLIATVEEEKKEELRIKAKDMVEKYGKAKAELMAVEAIRAKKITEGELHFIFDVIKSIKVEEKVEGGEADDPAKVL